MRDELELLLEGQEPEEEEAVEVLPPPRTALVKRRTENREGPEEVKAERRGADWPEEEKVGSDGGTGLSAAAWRVGQEGAEAASEAPGAAFRESAAGERLEEPEQAALERLRTAGTKAGDWFQAERTARAAGEAYRLLERRRRAAEYRGRETGRGVHLVLERRGEAAGGEPDARAVDRQFQRDARRYDEGFTWQ